jgi:hypothetical protein
LKCGEELRLSRGSIPPNTSRDVLLVTRRSPTTTQADPSAGKEVNHWRRGLAPFSPRFRRARQSPGDLWWRRRSVEKEARSNQVLYSDWVRSVADFAEIEQVRHAVLHPGVRWRSCVAGPAGRCNGCATRTERRGRFADEGGLACQPMHPRRARAHARWSRAKRVRNVTRARLRYGGPWGFFILLFFYLFFLFSSFLRFSLNSILNSNLCQIPSHLFVWS